MAKSSGRSKATARPRGEKGEARQPELFELVVPVPGGVPRVSVSVEGPLCRALQSILTDQVMRWPGTSGDLVLLAAGWLEGETVNPTEFDLLQQELDRRLPSIPQTGPTLQQVYERDVPEVGWIRVSARFVLAKSIEIQHPAEEKTDAEGSLLPSPTEQLQTDLVRCLKELIPTLPPDPEDKGRAALALIRSLNQAFQSGLEDGLRDTLQPVINQLLQDIPDDYEGKRNLAMLVNGLLSTLNLAIQIHDDEDRPHVCSLQAVKGRQSDEKGYLRLLERIRIGSSQKSYALPSPDKLQLIETPQQDPDSHPQQALGRRGS